MTRLNLLPAGLVVRRQRARRIAAWSWVVGVGAVCALACGVGLHVSATGLAGDPSARVLAVQQQSAAEADSTAKITAEIGELRRRAQVAAQVSRRPNWSVLLALLAERRGADVVLVAVGVTPTPAGAVAPTGFSVQVSGVAETMASAQRYVLELEASGVFDEVRLLETARGQVGAQEAVRFGVVLALRGHADDGA